ncbi:hypothetical protein V6N11_055191 [Hibiscus sabdariffa]|uniref:Uncharacterized protein n=1 Tax=Hibiscus sabdariffa TaxID=183260 RepID=A0ABR2PEJ7_9ROSI
MRKRQLKQKDIRISGDTTKVSRLPASTRILESTYKDNKECLLYGDEGLNMVLKCGNFLNCWKDIHTTILWKSVNSVYHRAQIPFKRNDNHLGSPEELGLEFPRFSQSFLQMSLENICSMVFEYRLAECNVIRLTIIDMLSPYDVVDEDQFLAFSRARVGGFQFALSYRRLLFFFFDASNWNEFSVMVEYGLLFLSFVQHSGDAIELFAGMNYSSNNSLVAYKLKWFLLICIQAIHQNRNELDENLLRAAKKSTASTTFLFKALVFLLDFKLSWTETIDVVLSLRECSFGLVIDIAVYTNILLDILPFMVSFNRESYMVGEVDMTMGKKKGELISDSNLEQMITDPSKLVQCFQFGPVF